MSRTRAGFGETIAGAGGLALLVCMFLPWFGGQVTGFGVSIPVATRTGWESFGMLFDVLLIAAIAVAIAGVTRTRALAYLPAERHMAVTAAGAIAFVILLVRLVDPPSVVEVVVQPVDVAVERKPAAFAALIAAALIAYGGYAQRRARAR